MRISALSFPAAVASGARRALAGAVVLAGLACLSPAAFAQSPAPATGPVNYHLEAKWKPGGEGGWDYLAFDPAAGRLYVTRTDRVQVLDGATGALVGEVPGLDGGHGTALAPELGRGFATSGKSGTVLVFDLGTLKPVGEPVAVGKKPDAILYDPASRHVFAFNGESDDASVIDAATNRVVATIPLGGGPEFAATDDRGTVFVNLEDKSELLAIDVAKNAVTHRWPLAPGESPTGLSLDPVHRRLFSGCHNQRMIVLDADSGAMLAALPIGKGVDATAFDPGLGFAFASNGEGTLTVAQESPGDGFHVVENVPTQTGARTMALDRKSHAIYLATADFEPVPSPVPGQPRQRPKIVPGSFTILKFARSAVF